jgi:hypothetical protein
MNLDKSQKRIEKRLKRGFQGYPMINLRYLGASDALATRVEVGFIPEEGAAPMLETFNSSGDIREDVTVQTTIIKIIDRVEAKTVTLDETVGLIGENN